MKYQLYYTYKKIRRLLFHIKIFENKQEDNHSYINLIKIIVIR